MNLTDKTGEKPPKLYVVGILLYHLQIFFRFIIYKFFYHLQIYLVCVGSFFCLFWKGRLNEMNHGN